MISAALIIADKTDVRRSRVRQKEQSAFDIHDRVNYAVTDSKLKVDEKKSEIALNLQIDEKICSMYDYFEIFLGRMMLCRKSAEILGTTFKLTGQWTKSFVKRTKMALHGFYRNQNNSRIDEKIFLLYDNHQGFYSK